MLAGTDLLSRQLESVKLDQKFLLEIKKMAVDVMLEDPERAGELMDDDEDDPYADKGGYTTEDLQ